MMDDIENNTKVSVGRESSVSRNLAQRQGKSSKKQIRFNRDGIIRKQLMTVHQKYIYGDKIGEGSFGEVFKVQHRQLKITRALKVIKKKENSSHDPYQQLQILKKLDHPNVLKVYEYFETESQWLLITEFFEGKELFDEIVEEKSLSQHKAAQIFSQICKALSYIHAHQIVHRDIKPENILVRRQYNDEYTIKLIDWGLGSLISTDLVRKCGTPQYCAPEVVKGNYSYECDLWSLGVLLFVMLAGKFPFKGSNVQETLMYVTKARVSFKGKQWESISDDAKQLVSSLIVKDPKKRMKSSQCLKHPWILKNTQQKQNFNEQQLLQTLTRLKQVAIDNKFHAVVINFIQNYLSASDQQKRLKRQFEYLDENKDGVLSYQQLLKGYTKIYNCELQAQKVVQKIFTMIDMDGSNEIEYSEFVTFARNISTQFSNEQLREAFRLFDKDNNGKINKSQINELLTYEKGSQSQEFDSIIQEIDLDGDGSIDIEEFIDAINAAVKKVKVQLPSVQNTSQNPFLKKESVDCEAESLKMQNQVKKVTQNEQQQAQK